jgi:dTDP-4-amino-4,6-dideoxygalactose transaminase
LPNKQIQRGICSSCVIRKRDDLQKHLESEGVGTVIHYPIPPHQSDAYREIKNKDYPLAEKIAETVVSLPYQSAHNF